MGFVNTKHKRLDYINKKIHKNVLFQAKPQSNQIK